MLRPTGLARETVRAAFNEQRSAREHADFLFREVERRMLERLDLIKLQPVDKVLDVGCGSGQSLAKLAVRYPGARMIGADLADRFLISTAAKPGRDNRLRDGAKRWLARLGVASADPLPATMPLWLAADAHALAIGTDSIDMVWSNLAAHWFDDPLAAVAEWHRVIRPDGLLMFSAFGVDTLKEVRPAGQPADWPTYQDMHDWGDALAAAGFADPVMDVERLTLTYDEAGKFVADAQSLSMLPGLDPQLPQEPSSQSLSIEVIYGHAWCPPVKRRQDGLAVVKFHPSGSTL
jgi:malonyl-CoA O-methyltransferase